jgi:hypothetical protein
MTSDQVASLLELAEAKKVDGGWLETGSFHLTLHAAYNGASLRLARIEGVKLQGPLIFARGPRGEIHVVRVEDVYAGSVEPLKEKVRKAGFV